MKALTSKVSKSLPIGARLKCVDNTGAREVEIISQKGFKGVMYGTIRNKEGRGSSAQTAL